MINKIKLLQIEKPDEPLVNPNAHVIDEREIGVFERSNIFSFVFSCHFLKFINYSRFI